MPSQICIQHQPTCVEGITVVMVHVSGVTHSLYDVMKIPSVPTAVMNSVVRVSIPL